MKTIKKDKMVEVLLDNARRHAQLAAVDLDFADMAYEEMSVATRMAVPKKGYTEIDVIDEIYEYTGLLKENSVITHYIYDVNTFKREYKHSDRIK